jgi:hypothetical protein
VHGPQRLQQRDPQLARLALTRIFVETEEAHTHDRWGKTRDQFTALKAATAAAFDHHLAYRFWNQLRNFAQHGGLPATQLRVRTAAQDAKRLRLDVCITKAELNALAFTWSAKEKRVIDELPSRISLLPLADEAMAGLSVIDDLAIRLRAQAVTEDADTLRQALAMFRSATGNPAAFRIDTDDPTDYDRVRLPDIRSLDAVSELAALPDTATIPRRDLALEPIREQPTSARRTREPHRFSPPYSTAHKRARPSH